MVFGCLYFNAIKTELFKAATLTHPKPNVPLFLMTDSTASEEACELLVTELLVAILI